MESTLNNKLLLLIHQNRAAIYSIISLLLKSLSGPLIVLFLTTKYSIETQAIYYTFFSISAIQWIFELGFSTCLVQHLASAKKKYEKKTYLRIAFVFYLTLSIIVFLFINIYALWVFKNTPDVLWLYPWALYSIIISVNMFNNILFISEEGGINAENVYLVKLKSSLLYSLCLITCLFYNIGLYSLFLSQLLIFLSTTFYLKHNFKLFKSKAIKKKYLFNKISEMMIFQYKLSFVWISGYFFWNFYSIFFYKFISIEFAAKYGVTNSVTGSISMAMIMIIQTKRAYIGRLISKNKIKESLLIFKKSLTIGIFGYIALSIFLLIMYKYSQFLLFNKFLNESNLIQIITLHFIIYIFECMLIYLRAFKDEPLYKITIANYITLPIVVILTYYCNVKYIFLSAIILQIIFMFPIIYQFNRYINNMKLKNI